MFRNFLWQVMSVVCLVAATAGAQFTGDHHDHPLGDDFVESGSRLRFQSGDRWQRTASNGSGLGQGDPTTLTWGIVPDGTQIVAFVSNEVDGRSDLNSYLDEKFGDRSAWLPLFEGVFDRWSELSGLSYVYEARDDGRSIQEANSHPGVLGVRADIRIAGHVVGDGPLLAYSHFPDRGDIVFDTGDGFDVDPGALLFRNLVAHEHGHGLGLYHTVSNDSRALMQPFVSPAFDGPQFDDILGVQRSYGDALEKKGGNDSVAKAHFLGSLATQQKLSIGTDVFLTRVFPEQTDFVSIDDDSDIDVYAFEVTSPQNVSLWLRPMGPTYLEGPQQGTQTVLNTSALNDLALELLDSSGSVIGLSTSGEIGEEERIEDVLLTPGQRYFARITGADNAAQMYRLDVGDLTVAEPGDFDANGFLDVADIEALSDAVRSESNDLRFDVNGDQQVDADDRVVWVNDLKKTYFGDSNLDGEFNSSDLVIGFSAGEFEDDIPLNSTWATGDWNGDLEFGTGDLVLAFQADGFEKGRRPNIGLQSVPEPKVPFALMVLLASWRIRRQMVRTERKS